MSERRYTNEHEWASEEGGLVRMGISDYAQKELGDVVFVELPESGRQVEKGDVMLTVESVKAVSEVYAPVSGTIAGVNEKLRAAPELINSSPEDEAWIVTIKPSDPSSFASLMSASDYQQFVADLAK